MNGLEVLQDRRKQADHRYWRLHTPVLLLTWLFMVIGAINIVAGVATGAYGLVLTGAVITLASLWVRIATAPLRQRRYLEKIAAERSVDEYIGK